MKHDTKNAVGSPLGMKLLAALLRILPQSIVSWFAWIPVIWYYLRRPEGRRSAAVYRRMLGFEPRPLREFFFGLGQARAYSHVILDNMYLGMFGPQRFHLEEHGTDVFHQQLSKGRGLILLSAHAGNWHLAVNFLGNTQTRVHLVIDDVRQAEVRRQMDLAKESSRHLEVHDARGGPDLVFELKAALGRGEVVVLAGDRPTGGRRVRLPFLGGAAWFSTTAFSLALTAGAPVCTALTFRTGTRRYECFGIGPFSGDRKNGSSTRAGTRASRADGMAAEFAGHLARLVQRFPRQWFNFFDFWSDS